MPWWRRTAGSVALALVLAGALLGARVATATESSPPPWDAKPFEAPRNGVDRALLLHDGQTFAAVAKDPTLSSSERFYGNRVEHAYRAGRPMLAWLAWASSLGGGSAVPEALLVLSALGVAALVAASGAVAATLGRDPSRAWIVLLLPGTVAAMCYVGLADALATALVLGGLAAWRGRQVALAVALLAVACLTRETGLIAVAALLAVHRVRAAPVALAALPYLAWISFVRVRLGSWPFGASSSGARFTTPFDGWWTAAQDADLVWWLVLAVTIAVVIVGLPRLPGELRAFAVLWAIVATSMGWQVWARWFDFPRVLLPLTTVCVVAMLPRRTEVDA